MSAHPPIKKLERTFEDVERWALAIAPELLRRAEDYTAPPGFGGQPYDEAAIDEAFRLACYACDKAIELSKVLQEPDA